jgi:DNA-directed DNA polymerase III PolC
MLAQAASYGAKVVSITDRKNLYGVHEFLQAAKETGIRPIIGAQLTLGPKPLFAFVRNRQGFSLLCEILSPHVQGKDFKVEASLRNNAAGLVLASRDPYLLTTFQGRVEHLYAAITPHDFGAVPTARSLGIPLALLDEATFLEPSDIPIHTILRAIALGKTLGNLEKEETANQEQILLSPEEFGRVASSWPEATQGTERIAGLCQYDTIFNGFIFPDYQTETKEDPSKILRNRVILGAEQRYGELSDAIMDRLEYELEIIKRKGFSPYFLVMDDIVSMASRTCGRGSAAASIVSYSLGITNVDPIAHNLYFERFLTISRPDPPDIDVDFAWDERDNLMRRVIERFGVEHCARVANHNRFRPRSALRETAKAFGLPDGEITRREQQLSGQHREKPLEDPLWQEILQVARRLVGLPRGLSMHCGGMVITPQPICRYAPIETSADGYPLLSWEKEGTEAAGLVKIDLLGNRSLAVIRDALENLKNQGSPIDVFLWQPAQDRRTIEALAKGDSMGVFYIESPAMRQLQKKTGKGDFAHIVIHSSIIRPAANKYIAEYVRRLKGAPWNALHPRLAYILDETYGILCYQEDVSKTAVALAGFNEADADKLRKVISKKAGGAKLAQYERQFFSGCRDNGVLEETAREIWKMMLSFDGYSFCKPHSASYAMVSFQSAYLRVHHPAAFIAAVLSNQGGYYRPQAYISEARRMGLLIEGPDINRSLYRYSSEGTTVIVGFMAIGNLSKNATEQIIKERERNGMYTSLEDAASRVRLSREDIVSLVSAGVFDSLETHIPRSLQIRTLLGKSHQVEKSRQEKLFQTQSEFPSFRPKGTSVLVLPKRNDQELYEEFKSLGFLRDHHPLILWARDLSRIRRMRACDIHMCMNRKVTLLGWPIAQKEVWTKDGLSMNFVSFEDESALYETVLFPPIFERYRHLLFGQRPLIVNGTVKSDQGATCIEVSFIKIAIEETKDRNIT